MRTPIQNFYSENNLKSFSELTLQPNIQKAITEMGYETPSPIQAQALPLLLGEPTDFIGLAATGTGKTAAFAIPLLEQIDATKKHVQVLILCPTRELALQVAGQVNLLGKYKGIKALPIYGGSSYGDQIHGLRSGATVVVGTPGRVVDHIERGTLKLAQLSTVILDEADEMISMGFKEDLEKVLNQTDRENSKIWLFSATMSREVRKVADTYLKSPKQVQVNRTEMLSTTVEQIYFPTRESDKPEILCKLIEAADEFYGIIFCQTKALVVDVTQFLVNKGYKVDCLHGDKDQNARERTMQAFRDKKVTMLVCTDVASRGLDVKDVTHVINYSIPRELDSYVHRIGRTARSGKSGVAISLVTASHRGLIPRIEQLTKSKMKEGRLPSRREIAAKKLSQIFPAFEAQELHARAVEILDEAWKTKIAGMTAEEVAGRFMTMMFSDIFNDHKSEFKDSRPEQRAERPPREDRAERPRFRDREPRRSESSEGSSARPGRPPGRFAGGQKPVERTERREQRPNRFSSKGPQGRDESKSPDSRPDSRNESKNDEGFKPPYKKPRASENLPWMKRAPRT